MPGDRPDSVAEFVARRQKWFNLVWDLHVIKKVQNDYWGGAVCCCILCCNRSVMGPHVDYGADKYLGSGVFDPIVYDRTAVALCRAYYKDPSEVVHGDDVIFAQCLLDVYERRDDVWDAMKVASEVMGVDLP